MSQASKQPNIVMIVSDEERRNGWLDGKVDLPAHARLRSDGVSFNHYYTHTSPCSPSRASLYSGRYLPQHGVVDNVSFPAHTALDPSIPTIGSLLTDAGYYSAYLGKWHLSHAEIPDLALHGYNDFRGNDMHYTGSAWSGRYFDPIIANDAVEWLHTHADQQQPWILTIALVNPHDIMWFPIDHPSYQERHPSDAAVFEYMRKLRLDGVPVEAMPEDYPELFDSLPANFDDDLHTKPEIQRAWRHVRNNEHFVGNLELSNERAWLRQLDYYAWLHTKLDANVQRVIDCLDELGIYDDTAIVYTSDHGDACGSHGLRAKLPCVYEEVMGVPLIVKVPGLTRAGSTTDALGTHVDLAATICSIGGVDLDTATTADGVPVGETLSGVNLAPALADAAATGPRDHVLFAQDSAQSEMLRNTRYAVRGFFDGTTKYARYYGIGGGIQRDGTPAPDSKTFDIDAAFEDHDHEWYDLATDPHELVNLANDRSRRAELRQNFERLLAYESAELT